MATIMTSRQYSSGQPPLPARNHPGQSNATHANMGRISNQSNHSLHNPSHQSAPPPLPSREQPIQRKSFETASFVNRNTAKAFSDPDRLQKAPSTNTQSHESRSTKGQRHGETTYCSKTLPHQRTHKSDDAPPPLPTSLPPKRPPANYEKVTLSHSASHPLTSGSHPQTSGSHQQTFGSHPQIPPLHQQTFGSHPQTPPLHQQTTRKHSLPNTSDTAPPLVHHSHSMRSPRRQAETTEMPPQVPARPPKPSTSSNTSSDFESQFRFHEPCDFPEPETTPVSTDKTYPSEIIKAKKSRSKDAEERLGPL